MDRKSSALVPFAMDPAFPDRVPKERYFDPDFYQMEVELLWPRVWQMACRLEEIPAPRDFVEYEILDQSVVVVRTDDMEVRAFQNACRHRGVKVVVGRGTCERGFTCPFHGWCYGVDGANTAVPRRKAFAEHNLQPGDLDLVPVRCETWGGCAWINFDDDAPPVRECMEPAATILDAWDVELAAHREVVRGPPPRELEARDRGVRGELPRGGDASRDGHPRDAVLDATGRAVRAAARSSKRRSTTCAC